MNGIILYDSSKDKERWNSECDSKIVVYQNASGLPVVLSENNSAIQKSSERLATEMCSKLDYLPDNLIWIEKQDGKFFRVHMKFSGSMFEEKSRKQEITEKDAMNLADVENWQL